VAEFSAAIALCNINRPSYL